MAPCRLEMCVLFLSPTCSSCSPSLPWGSDASSASFACHTTLTDPDPRPQSSVPVITPDSHRQPLLKVSWWATLILSATWPPSALWCNIFTDLQDRDIDVFRRQLHVWVTIFPSSHGWSFSSLTESFKEHKLLILVKTGFETLFCKSCLLWFVI